MPSTENTEATIVTENLVTITPKFDPKASRIYPDEDSPMKKYHRQVTREEKLYNRDKATYLQTVRIPHHSSPSLISRSSLAKEKRSQTQNLSSSSHVRILHASEDHQN